MCLSFKILNLFGILSPWGSSNYRPSAPFLYEVASHVKKCHFGDIVIIVIIKLRRLTENFMNNYTKKGDLLNQDEPGSLGRAEITSDITTGFIILLAIFFPSCTGPSPSMHRGVAVWIEQLFNLPHRFFASLSASRLFFNVFQSLIINVKIA